MQLYNYQREGVKHLLAKPFGKPHSLLADAPGTGKTIMAIEAAKQAGCRNGLVICPAIAKEQWARQMVKWKLCSEDEIQILYGENAAVSNRPWIITNYHLIRQESVRGQLAARTWHVIKKDEAHNFKTHNSQQTLAVFHKTYGIAHRAYWKWALSGSIVPNRPAELYPLLKTMAPEAIKPYDNWQAFLNRYCGGPAAEGRGASNVGELTERIQPFMLRRELRDVWRDCPPIIENLVWLKVPYQLHPEWSEALYEATERRVIAEAKAPQVVAYIKDRLESGIDKLACVAFHREVIEYAEKHLAKFGAVKIYGGIGSVKRLANLAKFANDPACRVILLQIGSAGEAIDGLQHVTSELIEAEPEWSPGREDQAISRVWRLGQAKPVILTKLYAVDSYEERIYFSNLRKREVINVILAPNGGNFTMPSFDENLTSIAESLRTIATHFAGQAAQSLGQAAQALTVPPPVQQALIQAQPAPLALVPPPAPPAPPLQQVALAQMQQVAAQQAAAQVPQSFAPPAATMTREEFEAQALVKLQVLGQGPGMAKLQELNAKYGITRIGELAEVHFANYLASIA